jgi:outer membrane protein TolC
MKKYRTGIHFRSLAGLITAAALAGSYPSARPAETNPPPASSQAPGAAEMPAWLAMPLSVADALNLAEAQNAAILKAKKDLEAQYGVAVQTRAIVLPKVEMAGNYRRVDEGSIEVPDLSALPGAQQSFPIKPDSWTLGLQLVQSIYDGGRMQSSLRSARLIKELAILDYQTVVADALLVVRVAYDDTLLATNQIVVREASVALLTKQLDDTRRRFEAGVVPQFNVLRAEVELANARPPLIRARNLYRIAKQRLVNDMGINLPKSVMEDVPLQLSGKLEKEPYTVEISSALAQALEKRTELGSLRKVEELRREGVKTAKAGYLPTVQVFGGYGVASRQFDPAFDVEVHGWQAGARANWPLFDGLLTQGKVKQAKALQERSLVDLDDATRRIELEVRTAYSTFIEAKEVLESQEKVTEQAVEALRLANSRYEAGTGTQLEVLSVQTALTDARTIYVRALREYSVARSRLERAIGASIKVEREPVP